MRRLGLSIAIMMMLVISSTSAEIVEVPLPSLQGAYWNADLGPVAERYAEVVLPAAPSIIYGAWITIRGSAEVGAYVCDGNEETPWPWVMDIYASMRGESGEWWISVSPMPEEAGPFEWTSEFQGFASGPDSWDFLLDGEARVRLWGAPIGMPLMCSATTPPPNAQVTEATLYVEGEFAVQAESGTWGRLKSLYR